MPPKDGNKNSVVIKKSPSEKKSGSETSFSNIKLGDSYISLLLGALVVVLAAVLGFFYVKLQQPKQELLPPATIARNINVTINLSNPVTFPTKAEEKNNQMQQKVNPPVSKIAEKYKQPAKKTIAIAQAQLGMQQKTYIVQKGENLWQIAEKEYGSGYSWVSIAQANNLTNPGLIHSGNTLIIPSVTPIVLRTQQVSPTPKQIAKMQPTATIAPTKAPEPKLSPTPTIAFKGAQYNVQKGDSLWTIAVKAYGNGYKWVDIAAANHLANPGVIHVGDVLIIPRQQTL